MNHHFIILRRMANYVFNPKTLCYEKVETSRNKKAVNFLKFSFLIIGFAATFFILFQDYAYTPGLKEITAERQEIIYEIDLLNRDIINSTNTLKSVEYNDDHLYRAFFEVDPLPAPQREAGIGGVLRYQSIRNYPQADLLINTYLNLDQFSRQLVVQSKSFDEVIHLARNKELLLASKPSIQPISNNELIRFGSAFGMRVHPILKTYRPHNGIDLTANFGTNIYAPADGVVVQASYSSGGYGNRILIDHGFGYKTLYGHCSKFLVQKGQKVKRGEVIGKVGNTGLSTRSHLHYEVWLNNRPVNPINYYANDLTPDEYDRMIQLLAKADPSFDIN